MKKLLSIALIVVLLFSMTACGSNSEDKGSNPSGETIEKNHVLKFSDQNAENTLTNTWAKKFCELTEQKTNGSVKVELYPNATLTAYDIEPLQSGICDFLQYVPSSGSDLDSRLGAFDAPYIYENAAHRQATFNFQTSEALKATNEKLKESNVMLLGAFSSGYRQLTCNFPIRNLEDMRGAKIRVVPSDLYIKLFQAFGASATPMNFTEVATALITNVIDGQENPISALEQTAMYELQDYLMLTNHMPTNHGLWMNYNTYNELSDNQQKAVVEAAYEASIWMDSEVKNMEEESLQKLIDNGMTVIDETNGLDVDAFKNAGMTMYDAFADEWGEMVDLIKSVEY